MLHFGNLYCVNIGGSRIGRWGGGQEFFFSFFFVEAKKKERKGKKDFFWFKMGCLFYIFFKISPVPLNTLKF